MWPAERWHDGQSQCDVEPRETEKEERCVGRGAVWHAAANAGRARREYGSYRRKERLYKQGAQEGNQHVCAMVPTAEAIAIAGGVVAMGEAIRVAA